MYCWWSTDPSLIIDLRVYVRREAVRLRHNTGAVGANKYTDLPSALTQPALGIQHS